MTPSVPMDAHPEDTALMRPRTPLTKLATVPNVMLMKPTITTGIPSRRAIPKPR